MKLLILTLDLILPLSVGAFDPEHLEQLEETNKCPKCDLSNANLEGASLWRANLERANLKEANLKEANLAYVSLQRANLQGAKFFSDNYGFK